MKLLQVTADFRSYFFDPSSERTMPKKNRVRNVRRCQPRQRRQRRRRRRSRSSQGAIFGCVPHIVPDAKASGTVSVYMNRDEYKEMLENEEYPIQFVVDAYRHILQDARYDHENEGYTFPQPQPQELLQCLQNEECLPLRIRAPVSGRTELLYKVTRKGKDEISRISGHRGIPLTHDDMHRLSYDNCQYVVVGAKSCPYYHEAVKRTQSSVNVEFKDMQEFGRRLQSVYDRFKPYMSKRAIDKMKKHHSSPMILRKCKKTSGARIRFFFVGGLDQLP